MFAPRSPAGLNKATDALPISQRGDSFEREATQIADRVMRMPASFAQGRISVGSAAPVAPMAPLVVHPDRDGSAADTRDDASAVAMAIRAVSGSPGTPLESTTRAEFEQRFGHSFANVRVHTDADAISGARAVRARAFTVGDQIAFAPGQYAPHSDTGRRLLAHELTHTLQQARHPSLGIQREEEDGDASGCAVNGLSAKAAGKAADKQIQRHAHANDSRLVLETVVPRASKDVREPCPADGTEVGRIDLSCFEEPMFYLAEIKSHRSWKWGRTEYAHYALRVKELEERVLGGRLCGEPGDKYDKETREFDETYLDGHLLKSWEQRNLGADFRRLVLMPLPSSLVPSHEQDAGPFEDRAGQIAVDNPHLWYRNNEDGTVTYECRKTRDDEQSSEDSTASDPQLTMPFLRDSHPLLDGWLRRVETQPVPRGHAYAVAVSAPIFNAFKFASEGQLPWSRTGMTVQAVGEAFGEVLGVAGVVLTVGGLLLPEAAPVATATAETVTASSPVAESELAAQVTREAAARAAIENAARAEATKTGTTVAGAAIADPSLAPSPGKVASSLFPIVASGLSPTEYSSGPTPDLRFARRSADQGSAVPLPFTGFDQADALGRLAWETIAALVPYSGFFDITSRRELGLLRAAVLYANPAVISVDDMSPDALPEIGTLRDIDGHQYIVIGNYVGL